jgi:signal transduction histidine kinase/ActR/RegA family two-component response regulator
MNEAPAWPPTIDEYLQRFVLGVRFPAFLTTDLEGRVVSQGGDLSRYGLEYLHPGDRAAEQAYFLEGLLPTHGDRSALSRVETSNGIFADIHLFSVEGTDCVLLLDASREVSERAQIEHALRETQELLRQAEKMEALGRLAGGVAHDFNNLLTVILGYGQVLSDKAATTEFGRVGHEIVMAAKKAAAMTQQLLSFSRRQVRSVEVVDLNGLIVGVERLLQRLIGEDIAVSTVLDCNLGRVEVDRAQMEQILVNLAANARDAMPAGGRLEIRTMNVEVDEAFLRMHPSVKLRYGPHVSMTVTDTGCGMDAETCARVFEPFFTSKQAGQGTGLGLSIVYGIVTQAAGGVIVTSAIGNGTRVEVLLPSIHKAVTAEAAAAVASPATGTETILVVEDEEGVRNLMSAILTDLGYHVIACSEPVAALRICARPGKIDLLVTDLLLPHMNGTKLAESVTMNRPEMCVLYVSGYAPESFLEGHGQLPGILFLAKPFTRAMLADKVREALDRRKVVPAIPVRGSPRRRRAT